MRLLLAVAVLIFGYHYLRNGWPFNEKRKTIGNFVARLMWCGTFVVAYILLSLPNTRLDVAVAYFFLSFAAILIPHAIAQDMGRYEKNSIPTFQNRWISFFIKVSQERWQGWPLWKRTAIDMLQMLVIGAARGLCVFIPPTLLGASITGAAAAVAIVACWQPLAYAIGHYIPFKGLNNAPNSSEWGEFLIGAGWALALVVA